MVVSLESLKKGDIGVNASSRHYLFVNIPKETLRWDELFCRGKY